MAQSVEGSARLDLTRRALYRERVVGLQRAIREVEDILAPLRREVEHIETRLKMLRDDEKAYSDVLTADAQPVGESGGIEGP